MKLKDSIQSNSVKIIDLYNKLDRGILDTTPDFQRKLVWKKQHKYAFINTILMNFPFPEVYIASTEMDVNNLRSQEIVVDGKQRLSAIVDYIKGINDFKKTRKVISFAELGIDEKRDFLNYFVTVKDLKDMPMDLIKDIFQRINSTDYSLNSNERLNARYGDGEFSMFCKQVIDHDFNPTDDETDIIIDPTAKELLNSFFLTNNVFTENDKSRMYDTQFIMLTSATLLEGTYFGRSSNINKYLELYNSSFLPAADVLSKLLKAVKIINRLKFSSNSYWFNKANLFILLIELSKCNESLLDTGLLERELLDLEKKVDIYFTDEDLSLISEEERKYFEYSRQGSNELAAREHRGKVIEGLILKSQIVASPKNSADLVTSNEEILHKHRIKYVLIKPTETGLKKSIMDATLTVREFFQENDFHDYEAQGLGPEKKEIKTGWFMLPDQTMIETTISLYRANGRGDYRLWFSDLPKIAKANDSLAIIASNGGMRILNLSHYSYENSFT